MDFISISYRGLITFFLLDTIEWICWPDHVKNLAGFCVPTCPTGK